MTLRRALGWGLGWWVCACGASTTGSAPDQPPARSTTEPQRSPDRLAGATVYDSSGQSKACEPPREDCPRERPNREFLDQCVLRGFQVRRCGCESVCSGNVMKKKSYYDAQGNPKECLPEDTECRPPDTSAAFQDACDAGRHRLVVCGCEWLCDGPLAE